MIKNMTYLLKLLCDHGESFEDDLRSSSDGDNPLRAGAVRYINPSSTLATQEHIYTTVEHSQTPSLIAEALPFFFIIS